MERNRKPTECLLKNIIDEDIQEALRPLFISQKIFFLSNFSIISKFITPNYGVYHFKHVFGALIVTLANYYRFISLNKFLSGGSPSSGIVQPLLWFDCIHISVASIMIYIISVMQSSNIVLLIIKLQHALHMINVDRTVVMLNLKLWNWMQITSIIIYYVFDIIVTTTVTGNSYIAHASLILPVLFFDLNVINVSSVVQFISEVFTLWRNKMMISEIVYFNEVQEGIVATQSSGNKMQHAYEDILKSFRLIEFIFRFAICYYMFHTFFHVLATVQFIIDYENFLPMGSFSTSVTSKMFAFVSVAKGIILINNLSIACEKIYENVRLAENFCCKMMETKKSDLRRTCKNVLRFNRAAFRKLSVYGLFHVDAALAPQLLAVVLCYTVVLLQFAFL